MPHQVSVFAENKPGKIERVTKILTEHNLNIRAMTLSDAGDYGIIKLLLDNPEDGAEALKKAGITASLKEVVAVKMSDKPGGLAAIASILNRREINVEDAYGFIIEKGKEAVFIFQVPNPAHAEKVLREEGITLLSDRELYAI
jgi:hypothetical protein